jgi:hypothetical protein
MITPTELTRCSDLSEAETEVTETTEMAMKMIEMVVAEIIKTAVADTLKMTVVDTTEMVVVDTIKVVW